MSIVNCKGCLALCGIALPSESINWSHDTYGINQINIKNTYIYDATKDIQRMTKIYNWNEEVGQGIDYSMLSTLLTVVNNRTRSTRYIYGLDVV